MKIISDLTKDTRPSLTEILVKVIQDTVSLDKKKDNSNIDLVEQENNTFYYRVIYLFMQRSSMYYDEEDIEMWSKKELLKETILPKIGTLADEIKEELVKFSK